MARPEAFKRRELNFGDLLLSVRRHGPGRHPFPSARQGQRGPDLHLAVSLQATHLELDGADYRLRRGEMALADASRFSAITAHCPGSWLCLTLPRPLVTRRFGGVTSLPLIVVPRQGASAALFRRCLHSLWRTASCLPTKEAGEAAEAKVDLLVCALCEALSASEDAEAPRLIALSRVSEVIIKECGRPDFSPKILAERMGMSAVKLKALLHPLQPSDLIRQTRMAEARRLLKRSALNGLSISEVAHRVGISSAAHFSALYRQTFDVSPNADRLS